jgi:hypothetical protein
MLWFERQVVAALVNPALDDDARRAVEDYVDGTLRAMPEYMRAGIAAESLVLGTLPRVADALGRLDHDRITRRIERWKTSRLDPVRQYVRLLHSLVLFAEHELVPDAA